MQKVIKYTIFKTKWGYFGLAGTEFALCRTHLPEPEHEKVKSQLLKNLSSINRASNIECNKRLFKAIQEQIIAYFEGTCVNFSPALPLILDGFSDFARQVLATCRNIEFGRTISYGQLAKMAGRPGSARAVGGVMAKNPLPLLIPCHRIIRSDGKIGGFYATGGTTLKKRLLLHEKR